MKISTALNHQTRLSSLTADIVASGRYGASTHAEILERVKSHVYSDPSWALCPSWVHDRVQTALTIALDGLYAPKISGNDLMRLLSQEPADRIPVAYVRWQLRVDGEFTTSDEISRKRADGDDDIWKRVEGAHIWNHRPENVYGVTGWKSTGS